MSETKDVFFINVMWSNDRRDDPDFAGTLKKVMSQTSKVFFKYTLITIGNKRVDPWITSQMLMEKSPDFSPLIAVNPANITPFSTIKKLASLQCYYKNKIALNLLPGSFQNEMKSLNDELPFVEKQKRLREFYDCLNNAIEYKNEMHFQGEFYKYHGAKFFPEIKDHGAEMFFSGVVQSDYADDEKAYFVKNIKPVGEIPSAPARRCGLSFGVCARSTKEEAEAAMTTLFPNDRAGQMFFEIALSNDDTPWNRWIKNYLSVNKGDAQDFHLQAARNFWSPVPYLVGSYDEVASLIKQYHKLGYEFFVLDFHQDDFSHVEECIKKFRN